MRIDVSVDDAQILRRLRNGEKRFAYAVVNAINETIKTVQKAEREKVSKEFVVRKPGFVLRQAAIIKPFASVRQGRPYAEVAVGQKSRLLLSKFEEGGNRDPFVGKSVAVPVIGGPARPTFQKSVPRAFQFEPLAFASDVKSRQVKGRRRTFILHSTAKAPHGGVYQRTGKKRDDVRMVYSFAQNQRVEKRLDFHSTAERVTRRLFTKILRAEVASVLARHAGG